MTDDNFVLCQNGIRVTKCEYRALGGRCAFPGTMSSSTHGGGEWYCRIHWQQLQGRLTEAQAAEKVRERLRAGQPDWREAALQAEMGERPAARAPASGHGAETEITQEEASR